MNSYRSIIRYSCQAAVLLCTALLLFGCNLDDTATVNEAELDAGDLDVGDTDDDVGEHDADTDPEPTCDDGIQNGDETDIDCGGPDCEPCQIGESCQEGTDCETEVCDDGTCVDSACLGVDCSEDQSCYQGDCYSVCDGPDDCTEDERCYQGVCLDTDCSEMDCPPDQSCYLGACFDECTQASDCEDENAECLDGGCVAPSCNDGVLNGLETDIDCGGPDCDGCQLGQSCIEDGDCQESIEEDWSDCTFPDDICVEQGEQTRQVTHFVCGADDQCEENVVEQTQSCSRDTDELECDDTDISDWSDCESDSSDICSEDGIQYRTITTYECAGGDCVAEEQEESQACTFNTDGTECGDIVDEGDWSACTDFGSECSQTGERERTVTYYECSGGQCGSYTETETESCTRDTTGDSCGAVIDEGPWGDCSYDTECSQSGDQERTVTHYECSSGQCGSYTETETQSCSRSTTGDSCGEGVTYGDWSSCEGFSGTCGQTGTRSRTKYTYTCSGGQCSYSTSTDSETCTRNTDGDTCDSTSYGDWSSCDYDSVCDTTGDRTRSVTTYTCNSGSCDPNFSTETDTDASVCDRSTGGDSCGSTSCGSWSSCDYGDACSESGTQTRTCTELYCSGGSCVENDYTESQSCTRSSTDGNTCDSTVYGDWGDCIFSSTCSETGTQYRSVTTYTCSDESCESSSSLESRSCSRSTDGDSCGTDSCEDWSFCEPISDNTCSGEQERECTIYECSGGSCSSYTETETQSCDAGYCTCDGGTTIGNCDASGNCDCGDDGFCDPACSWDEQCCNGSCISDTDFCYIQ